MNAPSNGLRRRPYGRVDGALEGGIPPLHNHAGKSTQNHSDETPVIDAAFRAVDRALNRRRELPESHPELHPRFNCELRHSTTIALFLPRTDDPPSSQFQDKSKRQGHRQADDEERKQEGDTGSLEKRHDPLQQSVSSGERGA